jgi:hypothetical protein
MKANLGWTNHRQAWLLFMAAMVTCVLGSTNTSAQGQRGRRSGGGVEEEPAPTKAASPAEAEQVVALSVKQPAETLVNLFMALYPGNSGGRVVADFRCNNRILARVRPEQLQVLKEFLRQADVPSEPAVEGEPVRVFHLEHAEPDRILQEVMKMISAHSGASFTTDPQRKLLIVRGDEPVFRLVQKLLPQIDTEIRDPRLGQAEYKLRVVWLVADAAAPANTPSPPPEDLKTVLTELQRLGFIKPRMAAQSLIHITDNQRFGSIGSVTLHEDLSWRVQGIARPVPNSPSRNLELSMSASTQNQANAPLFNLDTRIQIELGGDPIVLGMSPTGPIASAFVVQFMH